MSSRLDRIKDWDSFMEKAHYRCDRLAKVVGASERNLRRAFKKRFGKPPQAEMDERRGEVAKEMLSSDEDEKSIIERTGFCSIAHFSRWFRTRFGLTPRDFRRFAGKISIRPNDGIVNRDGIKSIHHANRRANNGPIALLSILAVIDNFLAVIDKSAV